MKVLVLAMCFLLFESCSAKEPNAGQQRSVQHKGTVSEITAVIAQKGKAPNFSWVDRSGKQTNFEQFRGKVTVLNFWATWCGPCRREIPDLEAIHREYGNKGVKVIGVSLDRGPGVFGEVGTFVTNQKMSYPVVIDNGELEELYGNIRAIPTTFIINQDGKVVERLVGQRSKEAFLEKITPHL